MAQKDRYLDIRISSELHPWKSDFTARVRVDAPIGDLIPRLAKVFKLPDRDIGGNPLRYKLSALYKGAGYPLGHDGTISSMGIKTAKFCLSPVLGLQVLPDGGTIEAVGLMIRLGYSAPKRCYLPDIDISRYHPRARGYISPYLADFRFDMAMGWTVERHPRARYLTFVNGDIAFRPTPITIGDVIAFGTDPGPGAIEVKIVDPIL